MRKPTLGRTYPSRPPSPAAARGASRAALGPATGAHDRAPVVEDPARLAGLPYWLAE
jgi:hypothetical protein